MPAKPRPARATPLPIRPRVYLRRDVAIGPGKIDLLRQVDATHSISAAARAMGMSYKRAWLLIDALNDGLGRPVVATATGGRGGGGATLTPLGQALVRRYTALEERLNRASGRELRALAALLPRRKRS